MTFGNGIIRHNHIIAIDASNIKGTSGCRRIFSFDQWVNGVFQTFGGWKRRGLALGRLKNLSTVKGIIAHPRAGYDS